MTIRLISMNSVAGLQRAVAGSDDWEMIEVARRTSTLKPGVYRLSESVAADRTTRHLGCVLYKYDGVVYQESAGGIVRHPAKAFDSPPVMGQFVLITYENRNKASFVTVPGADPGQRTLAA